MDLGYVPLLDDEDLVYTQIVLQKYLDQGGEPIVIPVLFGDPAAHALGDTPLGISPRAGLALALYEANQQLNRQEK